MNKIIAFFSFAYKSFYFDGGQTDAKLKVLPRMIIIGPNNRSRRTCQVDSRKFRVTPCGGVN